MPFLQTSSFLPGRVAAPVIASRAAVPLPASMTIAQSSGTPATSSSLRRTPSRMSLYSGSRWHRSGPATARWTRSLTTAGPGLRSTRWRWARSLAYRSASSTANSRGSIMTSGCAGRAAGVPRDCPRPSATTAPAPARRAASRTARDRADDAELADVRNTSGPASPRTAPMARAPTRRRLRRPPTAVRPPQGCDPVSR